jgi:hypothetical protein
MRLGEQMVPDPPPKALSSTAHSLWFTLITGVFITCLITSNIIAVKLVSVFGLVLPAAIIIFPISYIFGDVLTEVYGYRQARRVIWLGFFCNLIAVVAILIGQILQPASFWDGQEAYERILGYAPRLLFASFLTYLVGYYSAAPSEPQSRGLAWPVRSHQARDFHTCPALALRKHGRQARACGASLPPGPSPACPAAVQGTG